MLSKSRKYLVFLSIFAVGLLLGALRFDSLWHDGVVFAFGSLIGALVMAGDAIVDAGTLKELEEAKAKMLARYETARAKLDKLERYL